MKTKLLDMTFEELQRTVRETGAPAYRAEQLCDWVYRKGVTDPQRMVNLPRSFTEQFDILTSRIVHRSESRDGTVKLLIAMAGGEHVEAVLIPEKRRATVCLSTQVGCAMGCRFCASGLGGLQRNLTAAEILAQMLHLRSAGGRAPTNVVFMGMGEPLENYEQTMRSVRAVIDRRRFGISARRVTISTIGLPAQIRRLAKEDIPITLAISLHAANDALRRQLIPSAARTSIEEIISAAEVFYTARKREVTLEYLLLGGVNDSGVCAEGVVRIARRLRCNVNLIGYNPVESLPFERPTSAKIKEFAARLRKRGVNVHVRRSRGLDAAAACGQLRRRNAKAEPCDSDR